MATPFYSIFFSFCTLTLFLGERNKLAGAQQCWEKPPDQQSCSGSGSGSGKVEEFAGLKSYLSGPVDSKLAVVMLTDIHGIETPHLRMAADRIGASGYYVVVPDLFGGSPYKDHVTNYQEWNDTHPPAKGFEDSKPIIEALKGKGTTSIGAVGFCWGAKAVVEFCKIPSIQAAVLIHPSSIFVEDIREVKVPLSIIGGEKDNLTEASTIKQFEEALNAKPEVEHFVKILPGCAHGWSLFYEDDDKVAVEKAEETYKLMLDWLLKYVK